jgi:hypothetical protein
MEIAVRAYNRLSKRRERCTPVDPYTPRTYDQPNYEKIFVFDTETREDERQALTFGSFVVKSGERVEQIALFYNPEEVTEKELSILRNYCEKEQIVKLYSLNDFVEKVFYPLVYLKEMPCIGFNLKFDISRIAKGYSYAKGWFKGGFTFQLSDEKKFPPIRIKHMSQAESYIEFQSTNFSKFKGHFICCQILAIIFTDNRHVSLNEACKRYNKKYQKLSADEHGKITEEYIRYNITDTLATAELFTHLKDEYERFGVKLPLTKVFSSASIGKAFLEELGITPFMKLNPDFPPELYGKIAQAYYGGRCECRIRKQPVLVDALDFTSEYTTLSILLGLYDFLIAEKIEYFEDTKNVQKLVDEISLDDLRNPNLWKKFNVIVELKPNEEYALPVRARYDIDNFTVGLNYVTSDKPLYYALPSVILNKLLTGRTPIIQKAIRFVPVGIQKNLKKTKILGMEIDPSKDNVFKILVEEKQKSRIAKDGRDRQIKILVNATSYGIYIELNREDKDSDVMVYSGNESFPDCKRFEKEGKFFHPIISTLITDGAKLLLGIGDCILQRHNSVAAYDDTDSLYTLVKYSTDSRYTPTRYSDEIIAFFDSLNPYDKQLVPHLLKVEEKGIWMYGLGTKRYVLFDVAENGGFLIKDDPGDENYSLHGLGHLSNPFGREVRRWQKEIWEDILRLEYGQMTIENMLDKYRNFYAISQFTVSTAHLMRRFSTLNKNKTYNQMIKPFSFFLIGFSNVEGIKPIAPFSKDSQTMPYSDFINYETGKRMKGQQYFKSLADELYSYINHPESKLKGDRGVLERRHVVVDKIAYIGKEADRIEENMSGLDKTDYNVYSNPKEVEQILSKRWREVERCGIPKSQFYALRKQLKQGKTLKLSRKTLSRLKLVRV